MSKTLASIFAIFNTRDQFHREHSTTPIQEKFTGIQNFIILFRVAILLFLVHRIRSFHDSSLETAGSTCEHLENENLLVTDGKLAY
jgi:hypothetical protein